MGISLAVSNRKVVWSRNLKAREGVLGLPEPSPSRPRHRGSDGCPAGELPCACASPCDVRTTSRPPVRARRQAVAARSRRETSRSASSNSFVLWLRPRAGGGAWNCNFSSTSLLTQGWSSRGTSGRSRAIRADPRAVRTAHPAPHGRRPPPASAFSSGPISTRLGRPRGTRGDAILRTTTRGPPCSPQW